jgi:hypothetical protein
VILSGYSASTTKTGRHVIAEILLKVETSSKLDEQKLFTYMYKKQKHLFLCLGLLFGNGHGYNTLNQKQSLSCASAKDLGVKISERSEN